ncbi:helix-turn-helix domain containing protein [Nocardiopsis sp. RSe5-2]|uniref:Helix-turn-helix domain containing protein n=1 Tax=Nocardiopsis endophytica TaxID=3018445 RepID=A0ABT4U9N7_9ACTN|nr:TetR/AcrR family transcriptional regulator [Nocardiopsis endophytica]MDA2813184.1 helix-turn-helix domain containing protein [Nocardiopsis endophytica]
MPRLWNATIEAHRDRVREAVMDAAWELARERGPASVTMSGIAERAGIGRATLYKYFTDPDSILRARHEEHVTAHLEHLAAIADRPGPTAERLRAAAEGYAVICLHRARHSAGPGAALSALVHTGPEADGAHERLVALFAGLVGEAAGEGAVRSDTGPTELARYCVHALTAAGGTGGEEGARRLAGVVIDGLRPPPPERSSM